MTPLAPRPRLLVPALLAGALSATVLLSACGGTSSSPSASGGSSRPTSASSATSGTPAPDATGGGGSGDDGSGGAGGSGSGGSGSGGSGVGNRNACKVLTRQDASSILGQAVDAGKDGSSLGIPYPSCTYTATGGGLQTVGLTIFDATATANLINQYKQQFSDLVPLPGVGDAALSEGDGRLVVATKGAVGCVVLRAGDVSGSAATSTQLMANICKKVFAG
jgi:hypothetical protein